jgi:hypothetical protein
MNGQRYENEELFKYLSLLITNTNEVNAEIMARIYAGNTLQCNGPFTEGKIRNRHYPFTDET